MAKQSDKTVLESLYDYQTRLQGVANDLAIQLAALALRTDEAVAKLMIKELPKKEADLKKEMARVKKLIAALEKVRQPTYNAAKDLVLATSSSVVQKATTETAKEFNKSLASQRRETREERFCKELTDRQQSAIIDGQGIDGATIGDWLLNWQRADLERISSVCKRASVESLSVADITKAIRGTKENNYSDGILATTKTSAVMIARTIINGVSNNARVETIKENADVIDGVKFIGTLDGKTCPHCASYDGYIWRGEEITSARRPPLHPNCRCTLIPYVELKDEEGNSIQLDAERPAANADFDKLAKDEYNANARQNGWKRRWDDLSASTRLKYYYQAQKDYETRTGKPAYRQVPSSLSFEDYFKAQPDSFKKAWLGARRYDLYKKGTIDEKVIFSPDLSYRVSTESLIRDGWKPEPLQITELAHEEKGKKSSVSQANAPDGVVHLPTRDQLPTRTEIDAIIEQINEARDAASTEASHKYTSATFAEMDEVKVPKRQDYRSKKAYERAMEAYEAEIHVISSKYNLREGADKIERFAEINKQALDILLPVDNWDSDNRRFLATLFDDKLAENLPENLRDDFNRIYRSALDYAGRIYDNIGIDAERVIGRVSFDNYDNAGQNSAGGYSDSQNRIFIKFSDFVKGDNHAAQELFDTIVHELGHATDHHIEGARKLIRELQEKISTDENGNPTPTVDSWEGLGSGSPLHKPTINVPWIYAMRQYRDGATEMTSVFFEYLAKRPELLLYDEPVEISSYGSFIKNRGSSEYAVRIGDVLRESLQFQSDKDSIEMGEAPKETSAIIDDYAERIENAASVSEALNLRKEVKTRAEIWKDIENDTKPRRQPNESDDEYEKRVKDWESLVSGTRGKVEELEDFAKLRARVLDKQAPTLIEYDPIQFLQFTPDNIDEFAGYIKTVDDDKLKTLDQKLAESMKAYVVQYLKPLRPTNDEDYEEKESFKYDYNRWLDQWNNAREFYTRLESELGDELDARELIEVTYERTEPDFQGVKLDNLDAWKSQISTLSPVELHALRQEVSRVDEDTRREVVRKEPGKSGGQTHFRTQKHLDMTKEAWTANFNEVLDYFIALRKTIDEVSAENAEKETIYEPIPVIISSQYGTFTPDSIKNLSIMLADKREPDFDALRKLVTSLWGSYNTQIETREPKKENYYSIQHFYEAQKLWGDNKAGIYTFLTEFGTALDAEKERRFGKNGTVEDLRLDGKSLVNAIRDTGGKEYFKRDELDDNLEKRKTDEMLDGFVPQKTAKKAAQFAKKEFGINVDRHIDVDVLNDLNQELIRARNMFGTVGIIENVRIDQGVLDRGAFGSYNKDTGSILLRPGTGRPSATFFIKNEPEGQLSTRSPYHGYRHEIGHAFLAYIEKGLSLKDRTDLRNELRKTYDEFFSISKEGIRQLSRYAGNGYQEMVAEAIAQILNGTSSPLAERILNILRG